LPFTNRSPNPDDVYFTDGVHDDLLTQLAKLKAFSVISRTSVLEYRDTAKNLREIAGELGVANIMEGAVQRAGNRVRINVQLIDADTDEHLWAEIYDRELTTENLFDIQSEIAKAIAGALQATLTDEEIAAVAEAPTDNVEAYDLYQQARRFALGESEIGYNTAIDLYEEALSLDPGFKLAWIGLAKAHLTNYWAYGGDPADREKSRESIEAARALDDDFPELYLAEGFYWYWGHLDYDRAIEKLEQAVALMPGDAEAHMWLGWARRRDGQWDAAIAAMQESLRLDPRVMVHWSELSNTLSLVKRQQEALEAAQKTYDLAPDNYWARWTIGDQVTRMTGDTDRAVRLLVGAQHTGDPAFLGFFIGANLRARNFDEVLSAIDLLTPEMEIARTTLFLNNSQRAWTLRLAGREAEAREQARIALERIEDLAREIQYDFRFSMAKARAFAVLGDRQNTLKMVAETRATQPTDAVEEAVIRWSLIEAQAVAGLEEETLAMLDEHLSSPSYETVEIARIEPAFDGLRGNPAFQALLERHE
jgi:TolB-like protein